MRRITFLASAALVAMLFLAAGPAAAMIQYTLGTDDEITGSGGTLSGPVVITIADGTNADEVDITIDLTGLTLPDEKITQVYLNVNPDSNLPLTVVDSGTFGTTTIDSGGVAGTPDTHKADGDGFFDVLIDYPAQQLAAGATDTITLSASGLTAQSFYSGSETGPSESPNGTGFHVVVRGQGLDDGEGSGWFGVNPVPEPGAAVLFGVGSLVAGLALRRRS